MKRNIFLILMVMFTIYVLMQPRPNKQQIAYHIDNNVDSVYLTPIEPLTESPKVRSMSIIPKFQSINTKKLPKNVDEYVKRYAKIAVSEMHIYQIPASITLAQGILESNCGKSELSRKYNNHFGIKCKSKGNCVNYHDDDPDDMFRIFDSAWHSFREHSKLLSSDRYKQLKKHGNDYKKWSYGLKKCGYATDKKYAENLIKIIEKYNLHEYDK